MNNTRFRRVISSAVAALMLASSAIPAFADAEETPALDAAGTAAAESDTGETSEAEGKRVEESYKEFYAKYYGETK